MFRHYGDKGVTRLMNGQVISKSSIYIKIQSKLDLIKALFEEFMANQNVLVIHYTIFLNIMEIITKLIVYISSHDDKQLPHFTDFTQKMDYDIEEKMRKYSINGFLMFVTPLACKLNVIRCHIREVECMIVEAEMSVEVLTFINRMSLYVYYLAIEFSQFEDKSIQNKTN